MPARDVEPNTPPDQPQTGVAWTERDKALEAVEANSNQEWLEAAVLALEDLAASGVEFTSDDVRNLIPSEYETPEMRALGPVMRKGLSRNLIEPVGWTNRGPARAHARPRRVYRGIDV